mmetsp:Transcript_6998/g.7170  ORF Transcript_6998/g.7170 Transcript_6998/m.7170 type:complete len:108 (+) Transcript_6998:115-438(+)
MSCILFLDQCIPESTGSGSITRNGSSLSLGGNVFVDVDVDVDVDLCVVTSGGYTVAAVSTILIEGTTAGDGDSDACVCFWGDKNTPDFVFLDGRLTMAQSLSVVFLG